MHAILLVDDEPNILSSLKRAINSIPWSAVGEQVAVESFVSPVAALERATSHAFDLVVTDYRMPEMDGVTFLERLVRVQPDIARIILSGYADLQSVIGAINRAQIFRFVSKPWDDAELNSAITQALQHRRLLLENARLADLVRVQEGKLTRQEKAMRELEQRYPGITQVKRAADGSIDLEFDGELDFDPEAGR